MQESFKDILKSKLNNIDPDDINEIDVIFQEQLKNKSEIIDKQEELLKECYDILMTTTRYNNLCYRLKQYKNLPDRRQEITELKNKIKEYEATLKDASVLTGEDSVKFQEQMDNVKPVSPEELQRINDSYNKILSISPDFKKKDPITFGNWIREIYLSIIFKQWINKNITTERIHEIFTEKLINK